MTRVDHFGGFRRRAGLLTGVVLALALFAGGAAAHFAHHVLDPACDTGDPHEGPCAACTSLHGAAHLAKRVALAPAAQTARPAPVHRPSFVAAAPAPGRCAPRAPPLA
jgi:hypothetical protein